MFALFDWVGLQKTKEKLRIESQDQQLFFIREINEDGTYVCDEFQGENHIRKHVIVQLPAEMYEKKTIRALFRVAEYFPDGPRFNERTETYLSIADIVTDAPRWIISKIIILCDSDCRALGIDPEATWPPVRA